VISPWLLWTLLAVLCWGVWAIVSKLIGDALTAGQSQALSTVGILPVLALLAPRYRASRITHHASPPSRGILFAFAAGVLTCLGNIAYYALLNNAKAATVVPLTAVYPIVTVVLAVLFLRERLTGLQCVGIIASLAAIYLFNVQAGFGISSALILVVAPIVLWGVAALFQKLATGYVSGETATCWFLAAFLPVALVLVWLEPPQTSPTLRIWALAVALGFTFALGNLALLFAFAREGKASVITPLAGLYPIVSIPLAMLIFGERVGSREAFAILCALAGVAAVSWPTPEAPIAKATAQA
jgi:drug/metabolite transporter (DMT)-like permease